MLTKFQLKRRHLDLIHAIFAVFAMFFSPKLLGWLACCAQPWLGLAWACLACLACLARLACLALDCSSNNNKPASQPSSFGLKISPKLESVVGLGMGTLGNVSGGTQPPGPP